MGSGIDLKSNKLLAAILEVFLVCVRVCARAAGPHSSDSRQTHTA